MASWSHCVPDKEPIWQLESAVLLLGREAFTPSHIQVLATR